MLRLSRAFGKRENVAAKKSPRFQDAVQRKRRRRHATL
jgi:hypothetical protein